MSISSVVAIDNDNVGVILEEILRENCQPDCLATRAAFHWGTRATTAVTTLGAQFEVVDHKLTSLFEATGVDGRFQVHIKEKEVVDSRHKAMVKSFVVRANIVLEMDAMRVLHQHRIVAGGCVCQEASRL